MRHIGLFEGINTGVYQIINTITKQSYIGSAVNIKKRLTAHLCLLINNKHSNIKLQRSFNKYGNSAFVSSVIELTHKSLLIETEQVLVNELKPFFNIRDVVKSNLGIKLSPETRSRMSLSKKGKPLNERQKNAIKELHKKRIGVAVTGKVKESLKLGPLSRIGKPVSDETRNKIRLKKIGKKFNKVTKKYE